MTELKPCPFCGGEADKLTSSDGFTSIGCLRCNPVFGVMVQAPTEAQAAEAWNTRHVETCKLHEVDALTQTLSMVNGCAWSECSECGCLTPDDSTYCINCGRKVEG